MQLRLVNARSTYPQDIIKTTLQVSEGGMPGGRGRVPPLYQPILGQTLGKTFQTRWQCPVRTRRRAGGVAGGGRRRPTRRRPTDTAASRTAVEVPCYNRSGAGHVIVCFFLKLDTNKCITTMIRWIVYDVVPQRVVSSGRERLSILFAHGRPLLRPERRLRLNIRLFWRR